MFAFKVTCPFSYNDVKTIVRRSENHTFMCNFSEWRHYTQHNDIQHNGTHHNDTQHHDTQHKGIQQPTLSIMTLPITTFSTMTLDVKGFLRHSA
jgi:hypothetical protein